MFTRILMVVLLLVPVAAQAQITLVQAQAEADAWMDTQEAGLTTDFQNCVAVNPLSLCHPTWSATVLPDTAPTDSALATVTNDDPGVFSPNVCDPACYDDTKDTWVLSGVDVPATSPVQLRTNTFKGSGGIGIQVAYRIQYDGAIYEKGRGLFGPASDTDWMLVE